jgi:hypothetical protein
MRQRGADAAAGVKVDLEDAALRRRHVESALTALRMLVEGNPRLAALMASRPALAPLLDCMEPSCRCIVILVCSRDRRLECTYNGTQTVPEVVGRRGFTLRTVATPLRFCVRNS